jgi:glycosyltransferase involved in cell wall biosynthesis
MTVVTERPLLSIIIPVLNQSEYLSHNLSNLAAANADCIEVIVVDGGSSDGFTSVIERFSSIVTHCISEPDEGQGDAINKGLKIASGKWVAFQNADDFYYVHGLRLLLKKLKQKGELKLGQGSNFLFGGATHVAADGKLIRVHTAKWVPKIMLSVHNYYTNQSVVISRELLQTTGLLRTDLHLCLDYEWFLRMISAGARVERLPFIIGAQRMHGETKSVRLAAIHDQEFASVAGTYFTPLEKMVGVMALPAYLGVRRLERIAHSMQRSQRP